MLRQAPAKRFGGFIHGILSVMQLRRSMEGLQLVSLDGRLILVQMRKRVLGTIVVRVIVRINGLGLKARDSIEFLDSRSAQTRESTENRPLDFCNLSIFNGIDEGILGLR